MTKQSKLLVATPQAGASTFKGDGKKPVGSVKVDGSKAKTGEQNLADITARIDKAWAARKLADTDLGPALYEAWKIFRGKRGAPRKDATGITAPTFFGASNGFVAQRGIPPSTAKDIIRRYRVTIGEIQAPVEPEESEELDGPVQFFFKNNESDTEQATSLAASAQSTLVLVDDEHTSSSTSAEVIDDTEHEHVPESENAAPTQKEMKEPVFQLSQDVQEKANKLMKLFPRPSDGVAYVNAVMDDILDAEIQRKHEMNQPGGLVSITTASVEKHVEVAPQAPPVKNPDGVSIQGCNLIYPPKGQAGEYSALACNCYRGCGHKCVYCYVTGVTKQNRRDFDALAVPRFDFIPRLIAEARKYQAAGITEQVMLSFTTDPYHPGDTSLTRRTLQVLKDHSLAFCTLTKGGTRALRDIEMFRPELDAFACTLTSLDAEFSSKWEKDAASPEDRIEALQSFHNEGIFNWVSLEPTLSVQSTLAIIRRTHPFVDLFKIGKANYIKLPQPIDWEEYTHQVTDLCQELGVKHYIKEDLQPYLPSGYHNPKRVPQHK